jgi:hypothetical protein
LRAELERERPLLLERVRLLLDPPREPAAERLADVEAALAPERAPVAAAFVVRRAPEAALRAVLRAEVPDERLRELLDDELLRERDVLDDLRELVERLEDELERLRLDDARRRPPLCARWSRGISFLTTSLMSCGISFSR